MTAIAIAQLSTGQVDSFSIHKTAERMALLSDMTANYDQIEKQMLSEFGAFMAQHLGDIWIHWNMRDVNFGFRAIEHRAEVHGLTPPKLANDRKLDMATSLQDIYGERYISHPRLETLAEKNGWWTNEMLPGAKEATAFEEGRYVTLHQSTLRKAQFLQKAAFAAADGTLKTDAKPWEGPSVTAMGLADALTEHWTWRWLSLIAVPVGFVSIFWQLFA